MFGSEKVTKTIKKEYKTEREIIERLSEIQKLKKVKKDALTVNIEDLYLYEHKFKLKEKDIDTIEELESEIKRITDDLDALNIEEINLTKKLIDLQMSGSTSTSTGPQMQ